MARINELCRLVREERNLTLDYVAEQSDLSISTICRCELGAREVPASYLRALFQVTRDRRLLQWFDPDFAQVVSATQTRRLAPPKPLEEILPSLIVNLEKLAGALKLVEAINRDGRVDESDDIALAKCNDLLFAVVDGIGHVNRSLHVLRHQSGSKPTKDAKEA